MQGKPAHVQNALSQEAPAHKPTGIVDEPVAHGPWVGQSNVVDPDEDQKKRDDCQVSLEYDCVLLLGHLLILPKQDEG
jgi:hypothetical protein